MLSFRNPSKLRNCRSTFRTFKRFRWYGLSLRPFVTYPSRHFLSPLLRYYFLFLVTGTSPRVNEGTRWNFVDGYSSATGILPLGGNGNIHHWCRITYTLDHAPSNFNMFLFCYEKTFQVPGIESIERSLKAIWNIAILILDRAIKPQLRGTAINALFIQRNQWTSERYRNFLTAVTRKTKQSCNCASN